MDIPSLSDIRQMQGEAEQAFRQTHAEMDIDMDYYYSASTFWEQKMDYYLSRKGFPKGFRFKTPAFAKFAVEMSVANIMTGQVPTVTVAYKPDSEGKISTPREQRRQKVETALQGILTKTAMKKRENPLRDLALKTLALGLGTLSFPIDKESYPEPPFGMTKKGSPKQPRTPKERATWARWERKRQQALPWPINSVHPKNIVHDPWSDEPEWAIEKRKVNGKKVAAQFGKEISGGGEMDLVTFVSEEWYCVLLNNQPLLDEKMDRAQDGVCENPDGLWYDFALSGFGDENDKGELQYLYQGIIRNNRPTFEMLLTGLNVEEAIRLVSAFPVLGFRKDKNAPPDLDDKEVDDFEMQAAGIWIHKWFEQHKLDLPDVPNVVINLLDEGRRLLEIGIGPGILRGEWRDETASGMLTRLEQARLPLLPAKASMEQAIANMLHKMAWQTKHRLREPITNWVKIRGVVTPVILDPDDIEDDMTITVDLTPPTDTEKAAKLEMLMQRHQAGAISRRRLIAQDDSPITDVDAEYADILAEQMLDLAIQQMAQEAMQPEQPATPEAPVEAAPVEEVPPAGPGGFQQEGAPMPVEPVTAVEVPAEMPQYASLVAR